jgi:DDE superfamily endonuclease
VKAVLPPTAAGKPIEVWFQDEARVGQQGTLTRVWAKRGTRPRAPRDRRYEWAYLFGAVCPARATGAALVMPFADSEAMNKHLEEISACVAPGNHAVVVLDGAGYHGKATLAVPDNITLLPLPPYSPELNPVENVWEYLRGNQLSNRVWSGYDAIVATCCTAWNALMQTPERIASIAQRDWASLTTPVTSVNN